MSWAKLDDRFFAHPKVIDLSKDAKLLFLCGLTYCAAHLTDGKISRGAYRMVAAQVDVDEESARELVEAGLWGVDGTGYSVHDYTDYNPSREQAETRSSVRAEAGRKGGLHSSQAKAQAKGEALAQADSKQYPVPVPVSNTVTQEEQEGGVGETCEVRADAPPPPGDSDEKPEEQQPPPSKPPRAPTGDAPLRALMTAYREAMFPNRDAGFHRTIPGSEWKAFRPHLKAVHGSGGTPEQMRQATEAALRRWPKRDMVNPRSVAANWTLLLEPDEPPKPPPPNRSNYTSNVDDETLRLQKRYLDGIPSDLWPELERRARKRFNVRISTETAYQTMQKLWRNESNSQQNGGMAA